jgi:hypothetical protein
VHITYTNRLTTQDPTGTRKHEQLPLLAHEPSALVEGKHIDTSRWKYEAALLTGLKRGIFELDEAGVCFAAVLLPDLSDRSAKLIRDAEHESSRWRW